MQFYYTHIVRLLSFKKYAILKKYAISTASNTKSKVGLKKISIGEAFIVRSYILSTAVKRISYVN